MENRASVRIYGREYNIAGDKPEEKILEIAEYVDKKMHLISRVAGSNAAGSIAILSAVNIAEEYFDALDQIESLKQERMQIENDSKYYLKMWEDAKKNFRQYKEDVAGMKSEQVENQEKYKELEAKCTEYENSFFDLQMENIQLKSEIEKLKNGER